MKALHRLTTLIVISCGFICLTACDHSVRTATTVYDDGSLDRTIVLSEANSETASHNIMGVSKARGWETVIEPAETRAEEDDDKHYITFTKHFKSVADANKEMATDNDTLFRIHSTLKNSNRWFFTYMEYSDTYASLNRFKNIPQEEYFTQEDYAFINRLPAEGRRISKSDSLYLVRLNEKIFDIYGARTLFEEQFRDLLSVMRTHNVPTNWTDSLVHKKENLYRRIFDKSIMNDWDYLYDSEVLSALHDMGIPLPPEAQKDFVGRMEEMEKRLNFISYAFNGKYLHSITVPGTIISSNADSITNHTLYWKPAAIKFLLDDYTMTVHSRKINLWQTGVSAMVVLVTVGLFFRRR